MIRLDMSRVPGAPHRLAHPRRAARLRRLRRGRLAHRGRPPPPVPRRPLRRDREGAPGPVQRAAADPRRRPPHRRPGPHRRLPQHDHHHDVEPRHQLRQQGPLRLRQQPRPGRRPARGAPGRQVEKALREAFRPEFLNRIDEIIVFEPLTEEGAREDRRADAARSAGPPLRPPGRVRVTEAAKAELVKEGYDRVYGARPLRRTVQRRIENPPRPPHPRRRLHRRRHRARRLRRRRVHVREVIGSAGTRGRWRRRRNRGAITIVVGADLCVRPVRVAHHPQTGYKMPPFCPLHCRLACRNVAPDPANAHRKARRYAAAPACCLAALLCLTGRDQVAVAVLAGLQT